MTATFNKNTQSIHFEAKIVNIDSWILLNVPQSASAKLPSRGQVMVKGTINGASFLSPLEPDGKKSHWLEIDKTMFKAAKADVGDTVTVQIEPVKDWPDPVVPADLQTALNAAPKAHNLWKAITPMARWDWIRWINATKQAETRARRIEVACSKLNSGMRRPCCFNRTQCTNPYVSSKGVLCELN